MTGYARSVALAALAACAPLVAPATAEGAPPRFQELVDATPAGALLSPAPGVYAGPV